MPAIPKSYKGVISYFKSKPKKIRDYYEFLPSLVEVYPYDISLSYLFSQLELAQNMLIYCGILKIHKTERTLTMKAIQNWHISREGFLDKFETVFGEKLDENVNRKIAAAQKIRDNIMHGKNVTEAQKREAIVGVLEYSKALDDFVYNDTKGKFRPFGDLRGFKGATTPLDKQTTRWVLLGMGFSLS